MSFASTVGDRTDGIYAFPPRPLTLFPYALAPLARRPSPRRNTVVLRWKERIASAEERGPKVTAKRKEEVEEEKEVFRTAVVVVAVALGVAAPAMAMPMPMAMAMAMAIPMPMPLPAVLAVATTAAAAGARILSLPPLVLLLPLLAVLAVIRKNRPEARAQISAGLAGRGGGRGGKGSAEVCQNLGYRRGEWDTRLTKRARRRRFIDVYKLLGRLSKAKRDETVQTREGKSDDEEKKSASVTSDHWKAEVTIGVGTYIAVTAQKYVYQSGELLQR
ncbi:hypothetical protein KM043_010497 [Ampulex compressa]|nr:hypothetical protein KM043_010497 [Ampulex compressa]